MQITTLQVTKMTGSRYSVISSLLIETLYRGDWRTELRNSSKGRIPSPHLAPSRYSLFLPELEALLKWLGEKGRDIAAVHRLSRVERGLHQTLICETLAQLSRARIYSTLDIRSTYSLMQEKRAFWTRFGIFELLVMPFGLTNAPITFQNDVLRSYLDHFRTTYIDDILIYSITSKHEAHIWMVLDAIASM